MEDNAIERNTSGMYECFHCGRRAVIWQSDFTFEDYGYEGEGLVQNCLCTNCGAWIEYMISFEDEDGEDESDRAGTDTEES